MVGTGPSLPTVASARVVETKTRGDERNEFSPRPESGPLLTGMTRECVFVLLTSTVLPRPMSCQNGHVLENASVLVSITVPQYGAGPAYSFKPYLKSLGRRSSVWPISPFISGGVLWIVPAAEAYHVHEGHN
jgi:hypothetical protein